MLVVKVVAGAIPEETAVFIRNRNKKMIFHLPGAGSEPGVTEGEDSGRVEPTFAQQPFRVQVSGMKVVVLVVCSKVVIVLVTISAIESPVMSAVV